MNNDVLIIIAVALGTILTRVLPFLIFNDAENLPPAISYLSKVLPYSIMAMLVVYCLRDTTFISGNHGFPELIAVSITIIIHLLKENTLLSILVGTITYMICIQVIFA